MSVEELWQKLMEFQKQRNMHVKYLKASNQEIDDLCNSIDADFPMSFIRSLEICNGEKVEDCESSGDFGVLGILSISNILRHYDMLVSYNENWNALWIPFFFWDGKYYAVLDLDENSSTYGKVYCIDNEGYRKAPVIWADSYEEWLSWAVNEVIQSGTIKLDSIYKIIDPDKISTRKKSNHNEELKDIYKKLNELRSKGLA